MRSALTTRNFYPKLSVVLSIALITSVLQAEDSKTRSEEKKQVDSSSEPLPSKDADSLPAGPNASSTAAPNAPQEVKPNPETRWPSWFQMSVSYRGRFEHPSGRNYALDDGDGYYLSRFRLEATFTPSKYVQFFAMTQDSRVYGYNDPTTRPSNFVDAFDLRQAYVDIHDKWEKQSLALRIGRQYLDLGSKRLVAVSSWSNATPVFDAAKLSYTKPGVSVDVFASTRISNIYAYGFNEPKKGENLYGTYISFDKLVPQAKVEPYLLWRTQPLVSDEKKHKGDSDLVTTGVRFFGRLPLRLDYTAEVAFQRGPYADDDVSAWAGSWGTGYTLSESAGKPKLLFEYNYATGDKAKGDGRRGTFDQLYASNHSNYGIADQVGWRNTSNYRIGIEVEATTRLKVQFDVNDFYLATLQDALYTDNGSSVLTNTKATSKHVGWEPDLQLTYKLTRQINVGGGYARLIPGAFLMQSTAGHSYNYPYLYWECKY